MKKPDLNSSESAHQQYFFAYCAIAYRRGFKDADRWLKTGHLGVKNIENPAVPALEWIHSVPNGAMFGDSVKSRAIRAGKMKAEGLRPGIPDIFLPYPANFLCGLYIEMKRQDKKPKRGGKGGLSDEQIAFRDYCRNNNYGWNVCYGAFEAIEILKQYLTNSVDNS